MFTPTTRTILGTRARRLMKTGLIGVLVVAALALPMQAAASDQVPLKGSEAGSFQVLGPCGTSGIIIDVAGTGYATQLGVYTAHYRECFNPATGVVSDGSFTLTAADGATVFGTYGGQAVPTADPAVVAYDDPGVIAGGTGRFAGASGIASTSGLANLATGEYSGTLVGSVSTPSA